MKLGKLRLYLYRLLFTKTIATALGLVLIFWIIRSLKLLDTIVTKGVSLMDFLQLSAYLLPYILYTVIPFALLIGVLIVYRILDADNELIIMRTSGMSKWQIAQPFLEIFVIFTIICLLISTYIIPSSYNKFQNIIFRYQTQYLATFIEDKTFNSDITNITFYIDNKVETQFEGIFINDHRNPKKSTTIFAQNGQLTLSNGSPAFILQNGIQFEHDLNQNVITSIKFDKYNLVFDYNQAIRQIKSTEHQELGIKELIFTPKTNNNFNELRAEGVKRILWPFLSIFAPLLLLAVLLNTRFSRKTLYFYPIIGTTLGFLMILCNSYASSLARFNWTLTFYIVCLDLIIAAIAMFFIIERRKV